MPRFNNSPKLKELVKCDDAFGTPQEKGKGGELEIRPSIENDNFDREGRKSWEIDQSKVEICNMLEGHF